MKKAMFLFVFILLLAVQPCFSASLKSIPLYFIPNKGQVAPTAQYYAVTPGFTLWVTHEGLVFDRLIDNRRDITKMVFAGHSVNPEISPLEATRHKVNYIKPKGDRSSSITGIPTWNAVRYKNIYPNIDVKVYGVGQQVEYDWLVKPGGDPAKIQFRFQGVNVTTIDEKGNLSVTGALAKNRFIHKKPIAYQVIDGKRLEVDVCFREIKNEIKKEITREINRQIKGEIATQGASENSPSDSTADSTAAALIGFRVGRYNPGYPLVIDPVILSYSTYLGANAEDSPARGIAIDDDGNAYITGSVRGTGFPVEGPIQEENNGETDVFISRLSSTGNSLVYSTFIGGAGDDSGQAIAVDGDGNAWVAGYTFSADFPLSYPIQQYLGNSSGTETGTNVDAFVFKLSASGDQLLFSTFLGGGGQDRARSIGVDPGGSVYVAGDTASTNFPVKNAFQSTSRGNMDAFVSHFDSTGKTLLYSTYLGGVNTDRVRDIAVAPSGSVFIVGGTSSEDFPIRGGFQQKWGGGPNEAYVAKLSAAGNALVYSTFLGGASSEEAAAVAVNGKGEAYVAGFTNSTDFPLKNAIQTTLKEDGDVFVSRLTAGGNTLIYSTLLGGDSITESATAMAVDVAGNAYVTGFTQSTNFPTANPMQKNLAGATDVFVTRLSAAGPSIDFSTYLGGSGSDTPSGIAIKNRDIYIAGYTRSKNFPIKNPLEGGYVAHANQFSHTAFVTKLNYIVPLPPAPPFGVFEEPIEGDNVAGSIAVMGWALDNGEVPTIKVSLRLPGSRDLIYIGEALFVEGVRSDIPKKYPDYPFATKAGWGYMLLTHFLPNKGNGTYILYVTASDSDGNETLLDTRTIICDNDNAVKPFGAIDAPAPGEVVSGTAYWNYGWALTPPPNKIPEDGSTIQVFIDGEPIGNTAYNHPRADIAKRFPGYVNSEGALAFYYLDTTAFKNGMHNIAWLVTDNQGNRDGVGSRFFYIQNSSSPRTAGVQEGHGEGAALTMAAAKGYYDCPGPVKAITGYGCSSDTQVCYPANNGTVYVDFQKQDRIEIHLEPATAGINTQRRSGYFEEAYRVEEDRLLPLPVGSSLDKEKGIFYWQPGPWFKGEFQLLFIKRDINGDRAKKRVKIRLKFD